MGYYLGNFEHTYIEQHLFKTRLDFIVVYTTVMYHDYILSLSLLFDPTC